MSYSAWISRLFSCRHGGLVIVMLLFVVVATVVRVGLLVRSAGEVDWDYSLLGGMLSGFIFDVGASLLWGLPIWLLLTLLPGGFFERRWGRALAHLGLLAALALMLFGAVAEWLFWDEFGVRFNFIAVDYLVYTTEVMANINESYPMPAIIGGLLMVTMGFYALFLRTGLVDRWLDAANTSWRPRNRAAGIWLAAIVATAWGLDQDRLPQFNNTYNRELAKNGEWSLFNAFWNNELAYDEFYVSLPLDEAFATIRTELAKDGSRFLTDDPRDILRWVENPGEEQQLNVIQITVESLSASFLGRVDPESTVTPYLDELATRSVSFTNLYATGTRTTRGMEALALSLPPTPGRSLIKRPRNADLFSLASVFNSRGYDSAFIYGGYGYFDNMNTFFAGNGHRIVDRGVVGEENITFANAWGACDEDLLRWTMEEADTAHAAGKRFNFFVMTTSNHRPFTFPEGKIDLPSKVSGRAGAVKYTDFAIGQFIREAASKPWFNNTVFVVVADHCASVAGRAELPVKNYRIPMFVHTPGGQIPPQRIDALMSQIDFAPTLLGMMNWSYASRFFGQDVRRPGIAHRALIGNYQKLGVLEGNTLTVLAPSGATRAYAVDPATLAQNPLPLREAAADRAIAYYQTASWMYQNDKYRVLTPAEHSALAARWRSSGVAHRLWGNTVSSSAP